MPAPGGVWALGIAAAAALTVGLFTRAATIALWIYHSSTIHFSSLPTNGEDQLFRMVTFWCIFLPLANAYSLDRGWRGVRQGAPSAWR